MAKKTASPAIVRETPAWSPAHVRRVLAPWSATALAIKPDGSRLLAGRYNGYGECDPRAAEWTMSPSDWVRGVRYTPDGSAAVKLFYYGGLECTAQTGQSWARRGTSTATQARLLVTQDRVLCVHDERVEYHFLADGELERRRDGSFKVAALDAEGSLVPITQSRTEGYPLAAFAEDGTLVLAGEAGLRVIAPSVASTGPHVDLPAGEPLGPPLGMHLAGTRAVVWAAGGLARYDTTKGFLGALRGSGEVAAACVLGDSAYVAIGGRVEEWDLTAAGEPVPPRCGRPLGIALTPSGQVVSVSRAARAIQVWSLDPVALASSLPLAYEPRGWALAADGDTLAVGDTGPIDLYSLASGQHLGTLPQGDTVDQVHATSDNRILVLSSSLHEMRLWSLATREQCLLTTRLQPANEYDKPAVHDLRVFLPNKHGHSGVWQLDHQFPLQAHLAAPKLPPLKTSKEWRSSALRDDGKVAIVVSPKKMHVYDLEARTLTWEFAVPDHARVLLASGDFIVVDSPDEVKAWHVPSKKGKALKLGARPRRCVALPEGRAALAVDDKTLRIVELASGKELGVETTEAAVAELAFRAGRLVGITDDGEVIVWKVS
ncbi:MAG: WD40 repeat domain-containing protein [Polyangiaceae bacterium]